MWPQALWKRALIILILVGLGIAGKGIYEARQLGFMRMPSYDDTPPILPTLESPSVLVFSKTGSFIHREAIPAAETAITALIEASGGSVFITENGAVHNAEQLTQFDVVVWNNVTGNVLTETQQAALKTYISEGGGWLGIHGSGDSSGDWAWQNEVLIGAHFIGHPMEPQFQEAEVTVQTESAITAHLPRPWRRVDEWYSFATPPQQDNVDILLNLEETTYVPGEFFGQALAMGSSHPIAWRHEIGAGRVFYTAMGHTAETFSEPEFLELLAKAISWSAGQQPEALNPDALDECSDC
jgi:type 1 glutamine amidotransferase